MIIVSIIKTPKGESPIFYKKRKRLRSAKTIKNETNMLQKNNKRFISANS
ncbi:hypothetical protein HD_1207 [[Haemophilus] ducreyi 35000HP]|uniref:Uncharacterized protein n=1 Tax=Haemophilus ducreyi (strain 35000HP / ATCC 700724) TaxID=233412 RepID=Q7VM14_HAEDU|nr:hypothetical protein HD_1207 [[Haemophilus] ducreyi 35000HP]